MMEIYVALGGNIGDTEQVFHRALQMIASLDQVSDLICSRYYRTKAVSDLPQRDYLNAVCRFQTSLDVWVLWELLQNIESALGKKPKPKNVPRVLDLDFLFYGDLKLVTPELTLPHPLWKERSFVLEPLRELGCRHLDEITKTVEI